MTWPLLRSISWVLFVIFVLVLTMLAASGCSLAPEPSNRELDPPKGADVAQDVALGEWESRLGPVDLDELPPIRWFEGPCLEYGFPYDLADRGCRGNTWHQSEWVDEEIHLVWERDVSNSSLSHELLHWYLSRARGGYDADHSRPIWEDVQAVDDIVDDAVRSW